MLKPTKINKTDWHKEANELRQDALNELIGVDYISEYNEFLDEMWAIWLDSPHSFDSNEKERQHFEARKHFLSVFISSLLKAEEMELKALKQNQLQEEISKAS